MPERKSANIMVNIEETLYSIVTDLLAKEGVSGSAFCRRLIIENLKNRGLLTDAHLARMAE